MSTTKRTHKCHADSNCQLVSAYINGREIVATYRCRRCERRWTERTPKAWLAEALQVPRCRDCNGPLAPGEKDVCTDCLFIRVAVKTG